VPSLNQIVERIRAGAGADFAFVLSKRGRLLTHDAPSDMPEVGRGRLVVAARALAGTANIALLPMPRHELVPYGGAAPVDVFLAMGDDGCILAVVMATWADRKNVVPAMLDDLEHITVKKGREATTRRARTARASLPPEPVEELKPTSAPLPARPRRSAMSGLITLSSTVSATLAAPPAILEAPKPIPRDSTPEIIVTEGALGRESLAAIARASSPEIALGVGALGRESMAAIHAAIPDGFSRGESLPTITVDEDYIGRETMIALEDEARRLPVSSAPDVRVSLASMSRESELEIERAESTPRKSAPPSPMDRATHPYVETPFASKRTLDAARAGRGEAPPRVTIKLEEADDDDG
jgi:hypothetical protein